MIESNKNEKDDEIAKFDVNKQDLGNEQELISNSHDSESFGEHLFNLFARVLNSPANRELLNSIRGEYGLLWYLYQEDRPVTFRELENHMQVVPGRMTDILKSLEKKGLIARNRSEKDGRVVVVYLLDTGKEEAIRRREYIHDKFRGINQCFTKEEEEELLRLLNVLLTYEKI